MTALPFRTLCVITGLLAPLALVSPQIVQGHTAPAAATVDTNAGADSAALPAPSQAVAVPPAVRTDDAAAIATLKADIESLKELESRTWNVLWGALIALLAIVVSGAFGLVTLPRKLVRRASEQVQNAIAPVVEAAKAELAEHKAQASEEIGEIATRLEGLVRNQGVVLTGRLLYHDGKFDDAIALLTEHLQSNPDSADSLYYRGLCYKRKGRDHATSAIADLSAAVETLHYSKDAQARFDLAEALVRASRVSDAYKEAQSALALGFRNRALAFTLLGESRRVQGVRSGEVQLVEDSLAHYDECLTAAPWHTSAIEGKAKALIFLQRYSEAIRLCEDTISAGQDLSNYRVQAATALWRRNLEGDQEAALAHLAAAQKKNPRDTNPWQREAEILCDLASSQSGDERIATLKRAQASLAKTRDFAPPAYRPVLRIRLCGVLLSIGDVKAAISEARAATNDNPRYVQNWLALATVQFFARSWPDATVAADAGTQRALAAPGKLWCSLVRLLARAFQGFRTEDLDREHEVLVAAVEERSFHFTHPWMARALLDATKACRSSIDSERAVIVDHWLEKLEGDCRHDAADIEAGEDDA